MQVTETIKLLNEIKSSSNFIKLNVSNNDVDDKAAHNIAAFLSHSTQLKELDLSYRYNNLQTTGVIAICKEMKHLTKLNISNNNISDKAAEDIAFVILFQNNTLQELDLSCNNLSRFGPLCIFDNMKKLSDLT